MNFDWRSRPGSRPEITRRFKDVAPVEFTPRSKMLRANTRKVVLYPDISAGPSPDTHSAPPEPRQPSPSPGPSLLPSVADQLDIRLAAKRKAQLKKYKDMERNHTSEWYHLSNIKEADERGSRASISVEGLRRPNSARATTDLKHMLHIAHNHFRDLHTVRRSSDE